MDPNTRQTKRAPVTLKIKFKSATLDQFIERYAVDVSPGGIFIRTKEPLAVGTQMRFEFQLRDATPLITGDGTVVWTREHDPTRPNAAPGMGVRFDRLGDGSQPILDKILAEKAKQPQVAAPAEPSPKSFMEVPTRVAPSPLVGALAGEMRPPRMGNLAPQRTGFVDERTDNTPLPRPMPFHSDADEFPEETFEEATKVRALDELVAATAHPESDPLAQTTPIVGSMVPRATAPMQAAAGAVPAPVSTARRTVMSVPPPPANTPVTAPTRRAPPTPPGGKQPGSSDLSATAPAVAISEPATPMITGTPTPPLIPPSALPEPSAAPTTPAGTLPAQRSRAPSSPGMLVERPSTGTDAPPATLQASPAPMPMPARSTTPLTAPVVPKVATATPAPTPTTSSRGVTAVVIGLLLAALVAAGAWFFFIRPGAKPKAKPTPQPVAMVDAGVVIDAQVAALDVDAAAPEIDAGPPVEGVAIVIKANVPNATVEIVETGATGPAPFTVELEKGKPFTARVTAPGMKPADLAVKGGDRTASAKLDAMGRVIRVTSVPPGAQILIDGVSTGKTTPADIPLSRAQAARSSIRVALKKGGFAPWSKSLTATDFDPDGDVMAVDLDATLLMPRRDPGPGAGSSTGTGTGSPMGTGSGSATGTGSGSATGTGSGSGSGSATGTGSGSATGTGTGSGSATGTGTGTGSATGAGSGSAPTGAGSGSAKPAGSGSAAPAGSGSGSGSTEPTPDWMK